MSQCRQCNIINEYVSDDGYVCYGCKQWTPKTQTVKKDVYWNIRFYRMGQVSPFYKAPIDPRRPSSVVCYADFLGEMYGVCLFINDKLIYTWIESLNVYPGYGFCFDYNPTIEFIQNIDTYECIYHEV